MPKIEVSSDVLVEISERIYAGEVKNLKITRYKSGTNAGRLFAEYSLKESRETFDHSTLDKRSNISNLLRKAAIALMDGHHIELSIFKRDSEAEDYNRTLSIKEN